MTPRKTPAGKYEVQLRHPALPKGRRYFTFDTEAEAVAFTEQWRLMKQAGLQPPAEMLVAETDRRTLGLVIRTWSNTGKAAPTEHVTLGILMGEVGATPLASLSYRWAEQYVRDLKVKRNLAPNSIRHRVQALNHALDDFMRQNPDLRLANPLKLLPKGYSAYTDVDRKLAEAKGGRAKVDRARDRRLRPGEHEAICRSLAGHQREDRERALALEHGSAMLMLYQLIHFTGLRLKEALTLTRGQVDMERRVIRAQSSKLWRGPRGFPGGADPPRAARCPGRLRRGARHAADGALFPMMDGEPDYRPVGKRVSDNFRTAFRYAGITT
jgi:integrase